VLQVALSLVLVTGTGCLFAASRICLNVGLGSSLIGFLRLASIRASRVRRWTSCHGCTPECWNAVAGVAGVESASLAMCGLQGSCAREDGYRIEGYQSRADERVTFSVNAVTPGYFSTVGMRLIAGGR